MARRIKSNTYSLTRNFKCRGESYEASNRLYAWYQFEQDVSVSGDLLDLSNNGRDLSPITTSDRILAPTTDAPSVGYTYPEGFPTKSAQFSDDVLERDDNSEFTFASSGGEDAPFSVAAWIKVSTIGTTQYIAAKRHSISPAEQEWIFFALSSGKLRLFLMDDSSGGSQYRTSTSNVLTADTWHHVVATYDGTGGANGRTGIKLYVDGVDVTDTTSGLTDATYTSMESTTANFTIGNQNNESSVVDFQGKMASLAVWSTDISETSVKALYRARSGAVRSTTIVSGISTLPPKVQLLERDIEGAYPPMNSRNGDMDAMRSRASLPFNDTNSFTFGSTFGEASICFEDSVVAGDFIDLTSSLGDTSQRFRFTLTADDPGFPVSATDALIPLVDITGPPPFPTFNSPKAAARVFLDQLALYTGSLQIDATLMPVIKDKYDTDGNVLEEAKEKSVIKLRHRIAGTGSHQQGNIIKVGGLAPSTLAEITTDNISFEPFDIRITDPVRLGTLDPIDGGPSSMISGDHTSPTIQGSGSIVKGISDARYFETRNYSISAFDESRVSVENDDFHNTGTDKSILEGFSSPAKSKTKIVIRCKSSNVLGDPIYHATGAGGSGVGPLGTYHSEIAGKTGSGFAYWNSSEQRWEMKEFFENSSRTTGGVFSPSVSARFGSPVGFTLLPSSSWSESEADGNKYARFRDDVSTGAFEHNRKMAHLLKGVGLPTNTFGFPQAAQYNATGSQQILLSEYINHPFLLEKVKVEVKGVFGLGRSAYFRRFDLPVTKNFFLINQKTSGDNSHIVQDYPSTVNQHTAGVTNWEPYFLQYSDRIVGNREVIGWGKVGFVRSDNRLVTGSNENFQIVNEDYDVLKIVEPTTNSEPAVSSSFTLKIEPRLALKNDLLSVIPNMGASGVPGQTALTNDLGGANLLGEISGRQIASSLGASEHLITTSSLLKFEDTPEATEKALRPKKDYYKVSPYLLMPKDRLIIGWQNIPTLEESGQLDNGETGHGTTEQVIADEIVDMLQDVKITLYGSSISADKEYHDTLNQNLSTKSVQEVIFGDPLLDQYEVEPEIVLSGSTYDALFFGDMFASDTGVRGRRASIAKGEAGSTGSLAKNYGLSNQDVRYRDSLSAHIEHFLSDATFFTGTSGDPFDPGETVTVGGVSRSAVVLSNNPVGPSYKLLRQVGVMGSPDFSRKIARSPASNYLMAPGGGLATKASFLAVNTSFNSTVLKVFSGSKADVFGVTSFGSPEISTPPAPEPPKFLSSTSTKFLIASLFSASPVVSLDTDGYSWPILSVLGSGVVPEIRGAKYGFISPTPISPKTYFRRSSYGQFRDLIEQPPETYTVGMVNLDEGTENAEVTDWPGNDSPVKARFFSRNGTPDIDPLDTNSQNLSIFNTSSFPYYDGESRDRDVINDPPPDLTDKTGIEEAVSSIIDGEA